ncbi:hypothetical protein T440DRAFT_489540 [Plenodomus tracheiphilus IPT5]|uniref:Uncharacterized protein n=1 Tax=Plenodomus tracheiphilus IPT5 TaxID=1408161 RepID=A0A6A7B5X3_9PLEO|nr:hypothetical protein T440DRAFT_489540 [Plenodomus tracheiphilus IPT5]
MISVSRLLLSGLCFLCAATCSAAQYPARPSAPGVAFRLTPDYGIAAIYFKDGTHVSVAQVQGSSEYQIFMRETTAASSMQDSKVCQLLSPVLGRMQSTLGVDLNTCLSTDVATVKALLASLNSAVESYLGTNICFASLSLDVADGKKSEVAQEALRAVGLVQVLPTIQSAQHIVLAHRPESEPEPDEEWIVLAVDFSTRWYNIGLYTVGELGIVDPVIDFVKGPTIDQDNQTDALRDTLSHLLANPPPNVKLPKQIRHLVVYGDDSHNDSLHGVLTELLGTDLVRNARVADSVFDGSKYTACVVFEDMDTVDFETRVKPAFGCKWRSRLYSGDPTTPEL